MPVRQRAGDGDRCLAGRDQDPPFSAAATASTICPAAFDRFARVSWRTCPAVAVGAAQQPRLVLAFLPSLPVCLLPILTKGIAVGWTFMIES